MQLCADLRQKPKAGKAIYIYGSESSYYRLSKNDMVYRCLSSSIVYEVIKTISSLFIYLFIYLFYKKILIVKKASIFTLLEVFVCAKNCLYCLVFACFCFVNWFLLCCIFVRSKSFCKKKKKNEQT